MSCRLGIETWWGHFDVLTLENEWLAICLMPGRGGEIHQLTWKASGLKFFQPERPDIAGFKMPFPYEPLTAAQNVAFSSFYTMFPNAGPEQSFENYVYAFHGDIRLTAWAYQVIEQSDHLLLLELKAASPGLPFVLTRTVRLEAGAKRVVFNDHISYIGMPDAPRLPYLYGFHPYFGYPLLDEGAQLKLGEQILFEMPSRQEGVQILQDYPSGTNSSVEITNSRLGTTLRLGFEPDFLKFVWLWVANNPDRNVYVASLLPCSGRVAAPGGILGAIEEGTAGWLAPGESRTTSWHLEVEVQPDPQMFN